jgi:hypothetical protein
MSARTAKADGYGFTLVADDLGVESPRRPVEDSKTKEFPWDDS